MYPGHALIARYEGHYPCQAKHGAACDRLKVWLFLYQNATTDEPSLYNFGYVAVGVDDARVMSEGHEWSIVSTGTPAHPGASVIHLDEATPAEFRRHWRVEDHLLLLLGDDGRVRPSHPTGGYSLYHYSMQRIQRPHWPQISPD